jgi:hypothetical protein
VLNKPPRNPSKGPLAKMILPIDHEKSKARLQEIFFNMKSGEEENKDLNLATSLPPS